MTKAYGSKCNLTRYLRYLTPKNLNPQSYFEAKLLDPYPITKVLTIPKDPWCWNIYLHWDYFKLL
jgi:hypothetical protein